MADNIDLICEKCEVVAPESLCLYGSTSKLHFNFKWEDAIWFIEKHLPCGPENIRIIGEYDDRSFEFDKDHNEIKEEK